LSAGISNVIVQIYNQPPDNLLMVAPGEEDFDFEMVYKPKDPNHNLPAGKMRLPHAVGAFKSIPPLVCSMAIYNDV
jgi:hypothetical protein